MSSAYEPEHLAMIQRFQALIDDYAGKHPEFHVLEAGCGSASKLNLSAATRLTGIDLSVEQLQRNATVDEAIQGDLQTFPLPTAAYDIIVCWDVLEHIDQPRLALDNLAQSLKPGGLMFLAMPNPLSWWGLATRFTPHWVHVQAYRRIFGVPDAGTDGKGPFPTYLRMAISPLGMAQFASRPDLGIVYQCTYPASMQIRLERRSLPFRAALRALDPVAKPLSRLSPPRHSGSGYVLEKR